MPATTHATVAGVRCEIYSTVPGVWWWRCDEDGMPASGPFRSSAAAWEDAACVWGADVRVAQDGVRRE